ncbi:MAG: sugar phosphate isomerase/epimerase family protein [Actinomycetales bacterium]
MSTPEPEPRIPVGLSTSSVYPLGVEAGFELAAKAGYDGVEVLVWSSPISQDTHALADLVQRFQLPILAIHSPTLLVTQRVWGKEAWAKITGAVAMAQRLEVDTIVAHPPFRWQRGYAEEFVSGVGAIAADSGLAIAVENMYPWRIGGREMPAYLPDHDPSDEDYAHITWDLSHAATAHADSLGAVRRMLAEGRMRHLHLADGSGSMKDEHLPPGKGTQPCAEVLQALAEADYEHHVVLELNTRRCKTPAQREDLLSYSLDYARTHLGQNR